MPLDAVRDSAAIDRQQQLETAKANLVRAMDRHSLWQACVALVTTALPCHSCTLMYDIADGYQPRRSLHYLGTAAGNAPPPLLSLDVAAPYLSCHPRVRWYTFSQVQLHDTQALQRLLAQKPAPGWREFIHLAFWQENCLQALLSIRMHDGHEQLSAVDQQFLADIYPLIMASVERVGLVKASFNPAAQPSALKVEPHLLVDHELNIISTNVAADQRLQSSVPALPSDSHRTTDRPLIDWLSMWLHDSHGHITPMVEGRSPTGLVIHAERIAAEPGNHPVLLLRVGRTEDAAGPQAPLWACLSPSEQRVAELVVDGLRNEQIATTLKRSVKTIESQITAIYRKLDVSHRAQLVRLLSGGR